MSNNLNFYEWLGGLIDADGEFYISKTGYGSIEITMHKQEIQTLYKIKSLCNGNISNRTKTNAVRWRLHKKEANIHLLLNLTGHIRTKRAQFQFIKICQLYNIPYKNPVPLTYTNAWLSGFFCGEGSIYVNKNNFTATLSISQKEKEILKEIQSIYNGNIYFDSSWNGWLWQCNNLNCEFVLKYFENYPLYNPYKESKCKGLTRFIYFKKNKYHLDITKKKKLLHFIKLINNYKKND